MKTTYIKSRLAAASMLQGPFVMTADQADQYQALDALGIYISDRDVRDMAAAMDANVLQPTIGAGTLGAPLQFLQTWLPGLVRAITKARTIDELVGMSVGGEWSDEEVVQQTVEATGSAVPYTDTGNIPLASWNPGYERRTVVRFEEGFSVGQLEEARTGRTPNLNSAAQKRIGAALHLEISRNRVGFYGYIGGEGRTFGYLNDPNLAAYITVADPGAGTEWLTKSFLAITADIRAAMAELRRQSGSNIDPARTPLVLAIASGSVDFLTVTSDHGVSVADWLARTYPQTRVVSVPELDGANGGANVFYLHADNVDDGSTDGGKVFDQIVPAKMKTLGVENRAKSYVEDMTNALAGLMLKRPWALVRYSGI